MTFPHLLTSLGIRDSSHLSHLVNSREMQRHQREALANWFDCAPLLFTPASTQAAAAAFRRLLSDDDRKEPVPA